MKYKFDSVKSWLDTYIAKREEFLSVIEADIKGMIFDTCDNKSKSIHIYNKIEALAEELDKQIEKREFDSEYIELCFMYKDYKVFELRRIEE